MTGNRPVINIPSPQSLEPPPATVVMKNGHKVNTTGDQWQLFEVGTTYTLYFARFRDFCSPEFVNGLKWAYYKRLPKLSLDKAYTDLGTFFMILKGFCEQKGVQIDILSESDMLNLRARNSERFLMVKGLLRTWVENGYYGLAQGTMAVICLKLKKKSSSTRMEAVDTLCPSKGPLLELEETLFNETLNYLYAEGKISLENYLLCKLTLVFGVRPIQLSKLTIKNLLVEQLTAGKNYGLLIPWAKQKIDDRPPVYFPLTQHLGAMLFLQGERVRMRFPKDSLLQGMPWEELPFFPHLQEKTPIPWSADCISQIIARIGKKANIQNQRAGGDSSPIKINPQRLRHTVGTRLATRGEYGVRDIAHYLLHSDIQSPRSYVDLKEVLLENFNTYWQVRLEANAKVALGIIDSEEAKRVKGPRITFSEDGRHRRGIGKCGKMGCNARVPLACYGCAKFRPLLDAPHHEYLQILLAERDRQLEVAPKHIGVFDTTIWYVRRVIEACNQIRSGEE